MTPDEIKRYAIKQVEALVYAEATEVLVDFLTPEQRQQLAEDWTAGRE